jgi:hypothetical protein
MIISERFRPSVLVFRLSERRVECKVVQYTA